MTDRWGGPRWRLVFAVSTVIWVIGAGSATAAPLLTTAGPAFPTGDRPEDVAFSPNGRFAVTVNSGGTGTLSVLSVSTSGALSPVGTDTAIGGGPSSVAFSQDGKLLATANRADNTVSVFFFSTAGGLTTAGAPTPTATGPGVVAFNHDGTLLATANSTPTGGGTVSMFHVSTGGTLTPTGPPTSVSRPNSLAFSPDGQFLATACGFCNSLSVYRISATGGLTRVADTFEGDSPGTVAFSPSGRFLASMGVVDEELRMYSFATDGTLRQVGFLSFYPTDGLALDYGTDGLLAITHIDKTVSIVAVSADGALREVAEPTPTGGFPVSATFDGDGSRLLTANRDDDTVSVFSVSPGGRLTPVGASSTTGLRPVGVAVGRNGSLVATANLDGASVSVFALSASNALTWTGPDALAYPGGSSSHHPTAVAIRPDGELLATANGGSISLFSLPPSGGPSLIGSPTPAVARGVAFSPDGTMLATAGGQAVSMFSISAGGTATPLGSAPVPYTMAVAFSRDGTRVATANMYADSVSVFSVSAAGALTLVGSAPTPTGAQPESVAFSPDGKLVATANPQNSSVSVFAVSASGAITPAATVPTDAWPVSVAFSPDGSILATANWTGSSISLFSVSAGGGLTSVGPPSPTSGGASSVAFSSDGRFLATSNPFGPSVSIHPLAAPALDIAVTSVPPAMIAGTSSAKLEFEANYPSAFECRLDTGSFASCTSPRSYAGLAQGTHTVQIRAKDLLGNVADSDVTRSWTVDSTPPNALSLQQPADGAENLRDSTGFAWAPTVDDLSGVDHYELWVDGMLSRTVLATSCGAACSAVPASTLAGDSHRWEVRAIDGVGNERASASRTFTVDATPPSAFALGNPADGVVTSSRRPALSWQAAVDAGVGVAGYAVLIDGEVAAGGLTQSATSVTPSVDLADGPHRWQVLARDGYGYERASVVRHFTIDTTAPAAAFTVAPNPALAGRSIMFDAATSSDTGGIVHYEWDLDGDGSFETDAGATATTSRAYAEPGIFAVQLRVTDGVGLSATARVDVKISSATSKDPLGISINDGARFTRSAQVTVRATWPMFASQMLLSNDGGFARAMVLPLAKTTTWPLDTNGGERTTVLVYARFQRGLTTSETYIDDIILDERAPVVSGVTIFTRTRRRGSLRIRAHDLGRSGLGAVQFANNRAKPQTQFRQYRKRLAITRRKGERGLDLRAAVYVRVRDRAGNLSSWRVARHAPAGNRGN